MSDGTCKWCEAALRRLEQAERHAEAGVKPGPLPGTPKGKSRGRGRLATSYKQRAHHRVQALEWIRSAMGVLQVRGEP